MPITALPTPPSRADAPATFASRANDFLAALPTFATEANALEVDVNAAESSATASASAADASRIAAQAAQAAAESAANAAEWDPATAYVYGDCVYGSDGQTYRAVLTSTNINPVGDTSGKWVRISGGGAWQLKTTDFSATSGGRYMLAAGVECTLPASPTVGDQIEVKAAGTAAAIAADPPVLLRNGNSILGDGEDKYLNGLGTVVLTWAGASYGGWV
jgi:hypothetical protein